MIKKPVQTSCCVYGCTNIFVKVSKQRCQNENQEAHNFGNQDNQPRSNNEEIPNVSFYRFPKNPEKLKLWTSAVAKMMPGGDQWIPSKESVICSDHFLLCDIRFDKDRNRHLKRSAVPYPFMNSLPTGNNLRSNFTGIFDEDGKDEMESKFDIHDNIDPDVEENFKNEAFQASVSTDKNQMCDKIVFNSLDEFERNISQELAICGEQLKNNLMFVDTNPLGLADHIVSSVPKDIIEEKIGVLITDFVEKILQFITESVLKLKAKSSECDPLSWDSESHKLADAQDKVTDSDLVRKNEVDCDADLPVIFDEESTSNSKQVAGSVGVNWTDP